MAHQLRLLFLFLFPMMGFGQITFENGYFISNNDQKTECRIRNMAWKDNPLEFEYVISESELPKKAHIADIKEFNVGESYKYKRFAVDIDRSSGDMNRLSQQRNPIFNKETLFLKVLIEGKINLYQYEDSNLIRYFVSTGSHDTAEQLVFKEYVEGTRIGQNNYYKQQLFTLMGSGKISKNDFEKLSYRKDELVKIFLTYNEHQDQKVRNFNEKQNRSTFALKIIAGIFMPSVNYHNLSSSNSRGDINFDSKAVPLVGIETELILPFNQNKWSLFLNGGYQQFSTEGKSKNNVTANLDYQFLDLGAGFRHYFYLNPQTRIFMDTGFTFGMDLGSELQYGPSVVVGSLESQTASYNPAYEVSNRANIFVGGGFGYRRYSAEVRYNFNRNLIPAFVNREAMYSSLSLRFGFRVI